MDWAPARGPIIVAAAPAAVTASQFRRIIRLLKLVSDIFVLSSSPIAWPRG
jgi:hypothetical protein